MRALIAILSCHAHPEWANACRETWLQGCRFDYRFFLGLPFIKDYPQRDVVFVNALDDYISLPFKTQKACFWALQNGYDFLFKCDDDTYVDTVRLMNSGFEKYDYSGNNARGMRGYASGGSGYWLSRKAMQYVVAAQAEPDVLVPHRGSLRGEDLWVGRVMRENGIECHDDQRYALYIPGPQRNNNIITLHDVMTPCKGMYMVGVHRKAQQ